MKLSKIINLLAPKKLLCILLLIGLCFLVAGCSGIGKAEDKVATETTSSDDQNKEAIQAVIEKEFNGPDTKYRKLWEAAMATQTADMSQEEYDATLETPAYKKFMKYMEDTYAPYFTENAYDIFSRTGAFYYSFSEEVSKISSTDIQIDQSENEDTLYNFTFNVTYTNETGETSDYGFDGSAIVPEEGKIGKIHFNDTDGLMEQIR